MSNYIKLDTGEVKTQGGWRSANKNMSLPRVWTADTLADLGLTAVLAAPKPDCTNLQQVVGNGVTTDANGNTVEAWSVVDKFADTTDEEDVVTTKAEHQTAYLAKLEAEAAEAAQAASKVEGIEILGVMCSATKEDQMGLTAVGLDYSMTAAAGNTFADTAFSFENGSKLVITNDNFTSIYNLWVPFRRTFFTPE